MKWIGLILVLWTIPTLAQDHPGHAWLSEMRDPVSKAKCCGEEDCFMLDDKEVTSSNSGFVIIPTSETIPFERAQPSKDGKYWVCRRSKKKYNGNIQCFFYAGSGS